MIGLCCHRRLRNYSHKLDASVETSEPHDFVVRVHAVRQRHVSVHRIPFPTSVTIASAPLWDRTARLIDLIWAIRERKYFCKSGLDRDIPDLLVGPSARSPHDQRDMRGLMVRDARPCRTPHDEGLAIWPSLRTSSPRKGIAVIVGGAASSPRLEGCEHLVEQTQSLEPRHASASEAIHRATGINGDRKCMRALSAEVALEANLTRVTQV